MISESELREAALDLLGRAKAVTRQLHKGGDLDCLEPIVKVLGPEGAVDTFLPFFANDGWRLLRLLLAYKLARGVCYAYESEGSILIVAAVTRDKAAVATCMIDREPFWAQAAPEWKQPDTMPIVAKLRSLLPDDASSLTDAEHDEMSKVFGYPSVTAALPVDSGAFDLTGRTPQ